MPPRKGGKKDGGKLEGILSSLPAIISFTDASKGGSSQGPNRGAAQNVAQGTPSTIQPYHDSIDILTAHPASPSPELAQPSVVRDLYPYPRCES